MVLADVKDDRQCRLQMPEIKGMGVKIKELHDCKPTNQRTSEA